MMAVAGWWLISHNILKNDRLQRLYHQQDYKIQGPKRGNMYVIIIVLIVVIDWQNCFYYSMYVKIILNELELEQVFENIYLNMHNTFSTYYLHSYI